MTENPNLPRSAHTFSSLKPAAHPLFNATHRSVQTGALWQLISPEKIEDGMIKTYPTMYPVVLVMDETGACFTIPEEVWTKQNKKKKFVNFEPLPHDLE